MPHVLGKIDQPHKLFERHRIAADPAEIFFSFSYQAHYLSEEMPLELFALCKFSCGAQGEPGYAASITASKQQAQEISELCESSSFSEIVDSLALAVVHFSEALPLETVDIPKPWGKEIWYTGIEKRGVCKILGMPLPWLSAIYPGLFSAEPTKLPNLSSDDPILLKILAPSGEEVLGDLYFELHTEKIEVYVITHIDATAWPTGVAKMRYGFNQKKIAAFENREQFTTAYLAAVNEYKSVRDTIDQTLASRRAAEGFTQEDVLPTDIALAWQNQLPDTLTLKEKALREKMEAFTGTREVVVGDVIEVERLTPHSLQHGIRAIEFQSPHYERFILSFAQKVLTQSHWDTQSAMMLARLDPIASKPMRTLDASEGARVEIAADFDSFQVQRLTFAPGAAHSIQNKSYSLVIGLVGETVLQSKTVTPEQAFFLTPEIKTVALSNHSDRESKVLIALPKPTG